VESRNRMFSGLRSVCAIWLSWRTVVWKKQVVKWIKQIFRISTKMACFILFATFSQWIFLLFLARRFIWQLVKTLVQGWRWIEIYKISLWCNWKQTPCLNVIVKQIHDFDQHSNHPKNSTLCCGSNKLRGQ